mmetsp:Transcript_100546/g.322706  ORF Transcript_100546/g.322706 Transcript_100546/m.322706 type:complete len:93 (+) Transcript_100546:1768-2046(+)
MRLWGPAFTPAKPWHMHAVANQPSAGTQKEYSNHELRQTAVPVARRKRVRLRRGIARQAQERPEEAFLRIVGHSHHIGATAATSGELQRSHP